MDAKDRDLIRFIAIEQIGVLARVDHNSDLDLQVGFLEAKDEALNRKRVIALDMSKKIAGACKIVFYFLDNRATIDEVMEIIKDVLDTEYDHPYSVSAKYNLLTIYDMIQKHVQSQRSDM